MEGEIAATVLNGKPLTCTAHWTNYKNETLCKTGGAVGCHPAHSELQTATTRVKSLYLQMVSVLTYFNANTGR